MIALLLALAVGVIRAQPGRESGLRTMLNRSCAPPCWQNIQPGITKREEALAIMEALHLVRDVGSSVDRHTGQIFWRWSADETAYINVHSPHVPYIWLQDG